MLGPRALVGIGGHAPFYAVNARVKDTVGHHRRLAERLAWQRIAAFAAPLQTLGPPCRPGSLRARAANRPLLCTRSGTLRLRLARSLVGRQGPTICKAIAMVAVCRIIRTIDGLPPRLASKCGVWSDGAALWVSGWVSRSASLDSTSSRAVDLCSSLFAENRVSAIAGLGGANGASAAHQHAVNDHMTVALAETQGAHKQFSCPVD
jgi:hypothetical protein